MKTIKKLLYLLTPGERKRVGLLMLMIMIMALLDMAGVASIMPFMAIMVNPGFIESNSIIKGMYDLSLIFGVENKDQFLFASGILVFLLLIISLSFKAFTIYFQTRFIQLREHSIGKRLVEGFLHQPYIWFLNQHSAELGKTVLSEVSFVVGKGLLPMINLIAQSTVTIALLILIISTNLKLGIIIIFTFGLSYILIYTITRNLLNKIGEQRLKANELRFNTVIESFGAIKEIKVAGLEKIFINKFSHPSLISASHTATSQIISHIPRFALEAVAFGGMLLVILFLVSKSGTFLDVVPIIALYAFAGYRLMPALQQIFSSVAQMRFVGPSLDKLCSDLKNLKLSNINEDNNTMEVKSSLSLENIYFNYPNSSRTALKNINLKIPARSKVGLAGVTGSGKTTLVDIILGLLQPNEGKIKVDDKFIDQKNVRAWQKSIGYVPQQIFLSDDTLTANIAFGVNPKDIDKKAVEEAAKIANLHEFINKDLPLKYDTLIGERGIRLSGGQRQRIGLARALYHKPKILIFDEATSALDNLTEEQVMRAVQNIEKKMLIIMIAHRLSSLKQCDIIYVLERGELKSKGKFEELIKTNSIFKSLENK